MRRREFYHDFLGFTVEFEHRFEPDLQMFMRVARGPLRLNLTDHESDGSPGCAFTVDVVGLEAFHAELAAKRYAYLRPGIGETEWGTRQMTAI